MKLDLGRLSAGLWERVAEIAGRLRGLPSRVGGGGASLKGLPALSLAVVVVWLLAAVVVQVGWPGHLRQTRHEMERATSFAVSNPVVEVEGRALFLVRAVMPSFENDELLGFLRKKQDAGEVAELQGHFDEVAAAASELLESHPTRSIGILPSRLALHGFATHLLVHASWLHLLATALVFLLAAPLLEERWGRPLLGGVIVLLGLAGGGAFYAAYPGADRALAGGSAVVAGLLVAAVVALRDEEVDLFGWLSPVANVELIAPAWVLAAVLALYELALWWAVQGALPHGVDSAVGYPAHAAGALLGGVAAFAFTQLGLEPKVARTPAQGQARKSAQHQPLDLARVRKLREQGDGDGAFALLEAEVRRSARNRNVVAAFWQMAIARGEPDRAAAAMTRLVQEELRRGAEDVAVDLWSELAKHVPSHLLPPQTLVQLAPAIGRVQGTECVVLALEQALDSTNRGFTAAVGMRVSQLALELDPELAGMAAHKALREQGLDEKQRSELENIAAALAPDEPSIDARRAKKPAPSVFFEEADRSGFGGVVDDLSGPADPAESEQGEDAGPTGGVPQAEASGFGEVDDLAGPADPMQDAAGDEPPIAELIGEFGSSDFGELEDLGGPADPAQEAAGQEPPIAELLEESGLADFGVIEDLEGSAGPIEEPDAAVLGNIEGLGEDAGFADLIDEAEADVFGEVEGLCEGAEPEASELTPDLGFGDLMDEPVLGEAQEPGGPARSEAAAPAAEPSFADLIDEPEDAAFGEVDDLGGAAEPLEVGTAGAPPFADLVDEPEAAVFGQVEELGGAESAGEPPFAELIEEPEAAVFGEVEELGAAAEPAEVAAIPEPAVAEPIEEPGIANFGEIDELADIDELSAPVAPFPEGAVVEATPLALEAAGLRIEVPGLGTSVLAWTRLRALSLAGVRGLGPKPVLLIDLVLDGRRDEPPLNVIRLRGNGFDPCSLVPGAAGAIDALRSLLANLLTRGEVRPLPDAAGAVANPVRVFESLEIYHEQILRAAARDLA